MAKRVPLAKISRPRLFGVVPRERLFALLDENHGRPLVWICGPPGAGKTTLVASYLAERGRATLWYQVDGSDTDPASLFHYLSLAADSAPSKGAAALPRFAPEHLSDLAAFARLFFRAFFARVSEGTVLVLDNCQEAAAGGPLHGIVEQAVGETPPGDSVIAISRLDAPPSFAQLTASGRMVGIGWNQLQLTLEEVRAVAAQRNLTEDWLVKALHQQSQGWAAGITLMLERLGHPDGPARELPADTREGVFNYFASLIFDQAPELTRSTLLSISCLPRVTPSLAEKLSGCREAPLVLEDFYRRRMFTDRRTGPEPVYQFHALFLAFLRQRAKQQLGAQGFAEHLSRCASALEVAQEVEAAMDLWLESQRWEDAARLALTSAASLLSSGRRQTLAQWIRAIPVSLHARQPWLVYWLGCAELQIAPEQGIKTLEQALGLFRENGDRRGLVECLTALLRGAFVGFHAMDVMEPWLDELLAEIERSPNFSCAALELKTMGTLCVTLFHIRPWHPLTQPAYRRAEELLPQCADPDIVLTAASGLLVVTSLCGDFDRGDSVVHATVALAAKDTASPSDAAWWFGHAGYLRFLEARYAEALDYLEHGRRIAESNGLRSVLEIILLWRSTVEWRFAGGSAANATLAQLEASPGLPIAMREAIRFLCRARSAVHRGCSDEAASLAAAGDRAVLRSGSRLEELIFGLCISDILIDTGRTHAARPLLSRSRALIERAPIYDCWRAAQVWLDAWLARAEGGSEHMLALLQQALHLARDGQRRYFLRLPDCALAPLLSLALEGGIEVNLALDMIRTLHIKPPKDAPDWWPWPVRIFTLGRFEIQVGGEALEYSRKLPRKTLLLLKVLVAFGGRDMPEQALSDALWSDEEGDAATNALAITVVRLRKLLGTSEAVSHKGGKVSLNPELCWVDAWAFEKRVAPASAASAVDLYGGAFLPEDQGESWSVATRERLRGKFIHALSSSGAHLESTGQVERALECYRRGIDADPIVEGFYEGLMRCYERLGQRSLALSAYRRLKQTLSVLLGVPPSDATRRLFEEMLRRQLDAGGSSESGEQHPADEFAATWKPGSPRDTVVALPVRRRPAR